MLSKGDFMSSQVKIESLDFIQGGSGSGKKELCKAMAEAFIDIKSAVYDSKNPHFGNKYATLGSVIEAIKPALASRGLWFVQTTHPLPGFASVETVIVHSSGETMSCGTVNIPVIKNDAQGYGSAYTYAKRYSLSTAFGIYADADDDANEASKPSKQPAKTETNEERYQAIVEQEKISVKPFMSDAQIMDYAEDVQKRLAELPDKFYLVELSPLVDYFKYCQSRCKKSLREGIESLLVTPENFIAEFEKWKAKKA